MREYLIELVRSARSPLQGLNLGREYLQALILSSLQRCGAMIPLAFHGGTALRFLYGSHRFSEDLDFALEGNRQDYNFRGYLQAIRADLEAQNLPATLKANDQKTVHSAFIQFTGLPFELGLTPQRGQKLSIKLEVDTNPPSEAALRVSLVRRYVVLRLQHHDRATLLGGKLHALLQRPFLKGRDIYDLIWFLSDREWPPPNLELLNNALAQTGWKRPRLTMDNWRQTLLERLSAADWKNVKADVQPFVESGDPIVEWMDMEEVARLLAQ